MRVQSLTDQELKEKAKALGVYSESLTRDGLYEAIIANLEKSLS